MEKHPETYSRRILLAVTGLSPQVITETLYALTQQNTPAFIPTEVHLITTDEGAARARLSLLSEDPGWFHRLRRDYQLPAITFDADHIHTLRDRHGQPLDDIRTPQDNQTAADYITDTVRRLTADPDSALHVSIAGGRKTMGFYLGYALSLFGRQQDRLSHVLVPAPFESSWNFFYPTPYPQVIETHDRQLADTADARVTLAAIPFVPLRHGLPQDLLDGKASYSATFQASVDAARHALGPARLHIKLAGRTVTAADTTVTLSPVNLAFYAWLAQRRTQGQPAPACPKDNVPDPDYSEQLLTLYRRIIGDMGDDERTATALIAGMDKNFFERRKSAVNKALKKSLGQAAKPYLVQRFGNRPHWTHGLELPKENIQVT